jgi:AraC family L-rhamnose operon regulatory protein RhaS
MLRQIPIYKDHDERYRADSCRQLEEAAGKSLRLEALKHGHYPGVALPPGILEGVKMVGNWDTPESQDWGLPWHRNEGIEVTFLETGALHYGVDGKEYQLEAGDLTITRPWQLHHVGGPNITASRLHWLIIDLGVRRPNQDWRWPPWLSLTQSDIEELTAGLRLNEQTVWRSNRDIGRNFQAIAHAINTNVSGSNLSRLILRVNEIFILLLDMLRKREVHLDRTLTTTRRTVQLFLDDLNNNPEHLTLEWTVDEMADSCGLGISQFTQHVKCLTNLTPMQFLTRCRIDRAMALLKSTPNRGITETAIECGFSSGQYFATLFKRQYGHSPREIRSTAVVAKILTRASTSVL